MAYVTNDDIERRLGARATVELTDEAGTGSADPAKLDEARAGAEGEVDSYLAARYAVPIDLVKHPEAAGVLRSITLDLAEFRLHCRRGPVPEEVVAKRDAAVRWLAEIAQGTVSLPSSLELAAAEPRGPQAAISGTPRVLTRDEMRWL